MTLQVPLFDFRCTQCGDVTEELVNGKDVPPCPRCGSTDRVKLIGAVCTQPTKAQFDVSRLRRFRDAVRRKHDL